MNNLTEQQEKILNYIESFLKKYKKLPIIENINKHFGYKGGGTFKTAGGLHITKLQKKGFLLDFYNKEYRNNRRESLLKRKYPKWYKKPKQCTRCLKEKSSEHFSTFPPRDQLKKIICKECKKAEYGLRKYPLLSKEEIKNRRIERVRYNLEKNLFSKIEGKIGPNWYKLHMDYTDYNLMLGTQNYCCAICAKFLNGSTSNRDRACIDHNHITGKVRGILCGACNYMISGLDKENDYLILYYAIDYLKKGNKKI